MFLDMYFVDDRLQKTMDDKELTHKKLAALLVGTLPASGGVGRDRITKLVNHTVPIRGDVILAICGILNKTPEEIGVHLDLDAKYAYVPQMDEARRDRVKECIAFDVQGRPEKAAESVEPLLDEILRTESLDAYIAVFARFITFLEHIRTSESIENAIQRIENLESKIIGRRDELIADDHWMWTMFYLKGICLRNRGKGGDLKRATNCFRSIRDDLARRRKQHHDPTAYRELDVAAVYQLTVLKFLAARKGRPKRNRQAAIEEVYGNFQWCREKYEECGLYRVGYPLRSMGKCAGLLALLTNEPNWYLQAHRHFVDAIKVFMRYKLVAIAESTIKEFAPLP